MATLATANSVGNVLRYGGGVGVNTNDLVVQTTDVSRYGEFLLMSTAGATQVLGSLDGTNYSSALALQDLGSASLTTSVIVTAANRIYRLLACGFKFLQVTQNGATAATAVTLTCAKTSTQR